MRERLALLVAVMCWGSSTAITKYALGGFPSMTLLLIELLVANVVIWTILAIRRGIQKPARPGSLAILGLFEPALAYAGLTIGLTYTTATNAALLSSLEAVFVVILAVSFLRERIGRRSVMGVVLAAAGVAVLEGAHPVLAVGLGDLFIVGGALSAAIYVTLASRMAGTINPVLMTAYQFLFGLLFTLPVTALQWTTGAERLSLSVAPRFWLAAVLAGGFGFAASFLLYNYAITAIPASTAGMSLNLIPVFGVIAAVAALGETFSPGQAVGAALILAGLFVFSAASATPASPAAHADADMSAVG